MKHTDEHGNETPAKSKVARAMRGPMHVDVTYSKGSMGNKEYKTVTHAVHGTRGNRHGYPEPAFVNASVRKHPRHREMIKAGYSTENLAARYIKPDASKPKKVRAIAKSRKEKFSRPAAVKTYTEAGRRLKNLIPQR